MNCLVDVSNRSRIMGNLILWYLKLGDLGRKGKEWPRSSNLEEEH